jgi:probable sporulation protein (polysaccharide deacetylase family)
MMGGGSRVQVLYLSRKKIIRIGIVVLLTMTLGLGIYTYTLRALVLPTTKMNPIYQGSADKKAIALTVNVDWGEEFIPKMLDVFETKEVKATFFLSGKWVEKHPELVQEISAKGHELGNHGYSHPHPDQLSMEQNIQEIKKTEAAIEEITGIKTNLFAPAYGEKKPHVVEAASKAGYKTIYWSLDTIDWQKPKPSTIVARIVSRAFNGAIVLMHPTENTVLALPEIIHKLKQQGYSFLTISEIIN